MAQVGEAIRETSGSLSTVFRNPGLRRINLAFAGSLIGDWAYNTAVAVWAYGVGGATAVGVWGVARLGLLSFVTPFAAMLADRLPRKYVMIGSDLSRAVLVSVAAALVATDAPAWTVFILATLASMAGSPFRPSLSAMLPALARDPAELTAANGTVSTLESVAFFVGPAIGGLLLVVTDIQVVFVFNALTFVWSAALVAGVHVTAPNQPSQSDAGGSAEPKAKEPFVTELLAGFRAIWGHSDLRLVTLLYCAQTIVAGASLVFVVAMAVGLIDLGPQGVGYLDSVLGVGAILGGLLAIARASRNRLAIDFGWGVLFWGLPLLLVAAWPSPWTAFAAMFAIGVANPVVDVNASTILQRLAPDAVMGRVFGALETALIGTMAFGSLLMPILIKLVGLRWGLTLIAALVVVLVAPGLSRLRHLDSTLREPEGLSLLRRIPLFSPLPPNVLESLARRLERIEVPAGTAVVREGEEGDRFYIVESGSLEATFQGQHLSTVGAGEPFGEIALLRDVPRTATVTALEDSVLQALDRETFLGAVTGNDEASNRADDLVSRRIPTT